LILISALVKVIGLLTIAMLNVIVEASHASAIAWRRLPAPLSELLTTTGSVVQKGVRVEVLIAEAYVVGDGVFRPWSPDAVVSPTLSEALELKLGRAATKTLPTNSVVRRTIRATKRPHCVRDRYGLMHTGARVTHGQLKHYCSSEADAFPLQFTPLGEWSPVLSKSSKLPARQMLSH
jgi:hypothetical protein